MALLPSTSVADDQKGKQLAKHQRQESPEDTVTDFARHLRAREISKAKQLLFMPINDPDVAGRLDDMLQVAAKSPPPNNRIHVFDSHTIKQMGVGLQRSRFGVVVLSPAFFAKRWPQWELDALVSKESDGTKVVLPIWHKVTSSKCDKSRISFRMKFYGPALGWWP